MLFIKTIGAELMSKDSFFVCKFGVNVFNGEYNCVKIINQKQWCLKCRTDHAGYNVTLYVSLKSPYL